MTLRAAPISRLWMLRPGEANETKKKLPILGRNDPMQRPLQNVLLISWSCHSDAQLLADSVRASNDEAINKDKVWKAGSTSSRISRTYFWGQCNEFIHSFQHILRAAKQPPATSCWFLHNRINVQQICKCDNPSLLFPCLVADFFRLRRGYGFF